MGRALKDESFGNFSLALPAFAKAGPTHLLPATTRRRTWRIHTISEAPGWIAKLVYSSNNYGLWYLKLITKIFELG